METTDRLSKARQDVLNFFHDYVSEIEKSRVAIRKLDDMVDGLLQVLDLSKDLLPMAVVNMYRSHSEASSGRGAGREYLSPEVAYMLGEVKKVHHYYRAGALYLYDGNQDPTKVMPTLKVIQRKAITLDIVHSILENLAVFFKESSNQKREIHTGGFFIFRYERPSEDNPQVKREMEVPIGAQSLETAISGLLGRESSNKRDPLHMENIRVYVFGGWQRVVKLPPNAENASAARLTGQALFNLALGEEV